MNDVGNLEILKKMVEDDNKNLHMYTGNNFKRANTGKDGWGEVVMAVDNGTIIRGAREKMHFILFSVPVDEYEHVKFDLGLEEQK